MLLATTTIDKTAIDNAILDSNTQQHRIQVILAAIELTVGRYFAGPDNPIEVIPSIATQSGLKICCNLPLMQHCNKSKTLLPWSFNIRWFNILDNLTHLLVLASIWIIVTSASLFIFMWTLLSAGHAGVSGNLHDCFRLSWLGWAHNASS